MSLPGFFPLEAAKKSYVGCEGGTKSVSLRGVGLKDSGRLYYTII